ncbi:MAG: sodium:solute symporter [Bacteroidetes bacterium]|nr:sodium:solute symporter [Bacteroidota bacterium]
MESAILLVIVLAYFALLLGIAFYTSRHSNNESFFIGNRNSKWWVVAFGMVGTSLSGMTFISVPGTVGKSGFDYFQVVIGYWIGYFAVAYILLPLYYKMHLTSIYTYLDKRLGLTAYKTGALFFILSRTLGATLRLYLVIKVLEKFILTDMGIPFEAAAIVILALILLYTFRGGVKTIVWTDTLQTTFMLLALLVCVGYIMHSLDLNLSGTWSALADKGLTKVFHTDPKAGNFFLKQILGGMFITIAMTGLDQEMMQKNISVSNLKDSKKNMIVLSFLQMFVVFIFLTLGGLLFLYANAKGITATGDDLFPTIVLKSGLPFIITICFVIGLISALFPSADGALTALTSSFCIDILGIKRRNDLGEKQVSTIRLRVHCTFAIIFLACIFFFREVDNGSLIQTLLVVAGYTYGPLLALFAFGIFTKRKTINSLVPLVCIASPVVCYILKEHDKQWLGGYSIGTELLIINATLTFLLLILCSKKDSAYTAALDHEGTTDENKAARLDGNESALQLADI